MKKSDAIKYFNGAPQLAAALNLTRQAIYKWPEEIPELYQYKLHNMTNGALRITVPPVRKAP